jgi:hypothetical protein
MEKTPDSVAALISVALASASALLALWLLSYGYAIGGFHHHDPLLVAAFRTGLALSILATLCGIFGLRRPNRLRWFGLAWAAAGLLFWLVTAVTQ